MENKIVRTQELEGAVTLFGKNNDSDKSLEYWKNLIETFEKEGANFINIEVEFSQADIYELCLTPTKVYYETNEERKAREEVEEAEKQRRYDVIRKTLEREERETLRKLKAKYE